MEKNKNKTKDKYIDQCTKKEIKKLRSLLIRIWFVNNWFTILVILLTVLVSATFAGLVPEATPFIGPFSHALKQSVQEFLEIDNGEYFSLFGSIAGLFSILFALGYASSNIKRVSYAMINKKQLGKIFGTTNLTITDQGRIISIENQLGIDIDGDNRIGELPNVIKPEVGNVVNDIFTTVTELVTITSISDDVLKKVVKDNPAECDIDHDKEKKKREKKRDRKKEDDTPPEDKPVEVVKRVPFPSNRL